MKKKCGNCKYFLPHRINKQGFNGKCKEIIIRENMSNIVMSINLNKEDMACNYFEPKIKE